MAKTALDTNGIESGQDRDTAGSFGGPQLTCGLHPAGHVSLREPLRSRSQMASRGTRRAVDNPGAGKPQIDREWGGENVWSLSVIVAGCRLSPVVSWAVSRRAFLPVTAGERTGVRGSTYGCHLAVRDRELTLVAAG